MTKIGNHFFQKGGIWWRKEKEEVFLKIKKKKKKVEEIFFRWVEKKMEENVKNGEPFFQKMRDFGEKMKKKRFKKKIRWWRFFWGKFFL